MGNQKLGVDLADPDLTVTYQGDLALTDGKDNVKNALLRRLNTPLGALFAHPEYGNPVFDLISDVINAAWAGKAVAGIRECLDQEPRIKGDSVVEMYLEQRQAVSQISYSILDKPGTENLVWQVSV